jgi:hypothetical protein
MEHKVKSFRTLLDVYRRAFKFGRKFPDFVDCAIVRWPV